MELSQTVRVTRTGQVKFCKISGCVYTGVNFTGGYCQKHYARIKRHGSPFYVKPSHVGDQTIEERFNSYVDKTDSCWIWKGPMSTQGYGQMGYKAKQYYAHRLSFEIHKGRSIREGMFILHSCDNPPCVNPEHLREGNHTENMADMISRNRRALPGATITQETADEIRQWKGKGLKMPVIAKMFNVTRGVVKGIFRGTTWKVG